MTARSFYVLLIATMSTLPAFAEPEKTNYDESKVPEYSLPDPLICKNGDRVAAADAWRNSRRAEVIELFETSVYGRVPAGEITVRFGYPNIQHGALGGSAVRKQIKISLSGANAEASADLLIYLPTRAKAPAPIFVGLNFNGNHTVADDPGIWLPSSWVPNRSDESVVNHQASEKSRGVSRSRWPVHEIVARGYAVATMYCGDFDPDFDDGFKNGVHPMFYKHQQNQPSDDQWGAIGAWAWGLSRALDYFETDQDIDQTRVAVLGHSRLGKTALWAGASDERFAMVISNNSGCGGAALSRRRFGETVGRINTAMPHWFCRNFHDFNDNEDALPVDQHMLAALVAPRPLYIASAEQDLWADPRGEFLALRHASPVFELLGKQAFSNVEMPEADQPLQRDVAYHLRSGKHDITLYDWQRYMDFADLQFGRERNSDSR